MSDWECRCAQCLGNLEPPEPCEYCYVVSSVLKGCDGSCDSLTEKKYRCFYGDYRWQGKPLFHNGGKP